MQYDCDHVVTCTHTRVYVLIVYIYIYTFVSLSLSFCVELFRNGQSIQMKVLLSAEGPPCATVRFCIACADAKLRWHSADVQSIRSRLCNRSDEQKPTFPTPRVFHVVTRGTTAALNAMPICPGTIATTTATRVLHIVAFCVRDGA